MRRLSMAAALAAPLLLPGAAAAQEPELPPLFSEVVEVRVVNIEVVVTDRQGNRVTGLGPDDFRLRVDGEVMPIDYFTEIRGRQAVDAAAGSEVATVPSIVPGRAVGTNYLVFIDDFFSIARDRNQVLDELLGDLSFLGPDDRMAIVAFDGTSLTMLTSWTGSEQELRRTVAEARGRPSFGLQRLGELRANDQDRVERRRLTSGTTDLIVQAGGEVPEEAVLRGRLDPIELNYASRLAQQVERSVMGAVSTLRSFGGPPGRKVMLLLSGGWPFSPAEFTINDFNATIDQVMSGMLEQGVESRDGLFGPLTDTANLLGYTLYAVDVPGMRRGTATDASLSAEDIGDSPTASLGSGTTPREEQSHDSLAFLAEETGGLALLNAQRDAALELVATDTRSYYWLGFTPERQENDERHRIEVEVLREGLGVRSREGFVDLSRQSEVTMMVESALLFGNPPSDKPLQLVFGKPSKAGRNRVRVRLEVGVPLDHVTLLPSGGRYVNELEVRTSVIDERGNRSETPMDRIPINGSRPPRPGELMWYETELTMVKRPQKVVVAVYDPLSGNILSSTAEVAP
jgi:VWFA-related protein